MPDLQTNLQTPIDFTSNQMSKTFEDSCLNDLPEFYSFASLGEKI